MILGIIGDLNFKYYLLMDSSYHIKKTNHTDSNGIKIYPYQTMPCRFIQVKNVHDHSLCQKVNTHAGLFAKILNQHLHIKAKLIKTAGVYHYTALHIEFPKKSRFGVFIVRLLIHMISDSVSPGGTLVLCKV